MPTRSRPTLYLVPRQEARPPRRHAVPWIDDTQATPLEAPARRAPRGALTPRQAARAAVVVLLAGVVIASLLYAFSAWAGGEPIEPAPRVSGLTDRSAPGESAAALLAPTLAALDDYEVRALQALMRRAYRAGFARDLRRMP